MGKQFFKVQENEQSVIQFSHAPDVLRVKPRDNRRWRFNSIGRNSENFGNRVHNKPHHHGGDLHHDNSCMLVMSNFAQLKTGPHVDNGNDLSTKIDHSLNKLRSTRNTGDFHGTDYLLHLENINTKLLFSNVESYQLDNTSTIFWVQHLDILCHKFLLKDFNY